MNYEMHQHEYFSCAMCHQFERMLSNIIEVFEHEWMDIDLLQDRKGMEEIVKWWNEHTQKEIVLRAKKKEEILARLSEEERKILGL